MPTGRNSRGSRNVACRIVEMARQWHSLMSRFPSSRPSASLTFTDADFRSLVKLAHEHAGISLAESKRNLVYSRLSRRLRALGLRRFANIATILPPTAPSSKASSTAISTNLTKFFREPHHFDHLRANVAAPLRASRGSMARARACGSGRPAARPAKSPTRSPPCYARDPAMSNATMSVFSPPTSTPK